MVEELVQIQYLILKLKVTQDTNHSVRDTAMTGNIYPKVTTQISYQVVLAIEMTKDLNVNVDVHNKAILMHSMSMATKIVPAQEAIVLVELNPTMITIIVTKLKPSQSKNHSMDLLTITLAEDTVVTLNIFPKVTILTSLDSIHHSLTLIELENVEIDAEQLVLKILVTLLKLSIFEMMVNVAVQKINVTQDQAVMMMITSHIECKTIEKI